MGVFMTRQKLPDKCDLCGKEISSEMQYVMEAFQGKNTFGDIRVRAKTRLDVCHPCWLEICKNGYQPNFIKELKNPQYRAGSKLAAEKYYIPYPEIDPQEKIAA